MDHLISDSPPPPKHSNGDSITTQSLTQVYLQWHKANRLFHGWIIGTLAEETLSCVVGLHTLNQVKEALKVTYAQEKEFNLIQQISFLRVDFFFCKTLVIIQNFCDNLATNNRPIENKMKVFSLLNSLRPKYGSITTSILKPPLPTYTELVPFLQGYELCYHLHYSFSNPSMALYEQK